MLWNKYPNLTCRFWKLVTVVFPIVLVKAQSPSWPATLDE